MRSLCWRHSCKYRGTRSTDKEPFPVQFRGVIASSPADPKSSCLFVLLSSIITSCFVHSSPSEGFCSLAFPIATKQSFRLFSWWLSSQMQSPTLPSTLNWILGFFFLLSISALHYFFLLNSSKYNRVSWFHFQTFCFQERSLVQCDQIPSQHLQTRLLEVSKWKYCREWGHFIPIHSHGNWNLAFCYGENLSRCINVAEHSKKGTGKQTLRQDAQRSSGCQRRLSRGWRKMPMGVLAVC